MTTVVVDSKGFVESLQTGVIPIPPDVAEDNKRQAEAKEAKAGGKAAEKGQESAKSAETKPPKKEGDEAAKKESAPDPDDLEGEDGLTPRQKREFTQAMQKTIGKKHAQLKEAEEFAAHSYSERRLAESRAEKAERELAELRAKAVPAPKNDEPEPTIEQFTKDGQTDWPAYIKASNKYEVAKALRDKEITDAKARDEAQRAQIYASASERISKARELVPDFQEVVGDSDLRVPDVIAGYMQESEMLAEIAYHLAKNPKVVEKLQTLRPDKALVEIGRIESTLKPFSADKAGKEPNGEKPSTKETGSATSGAGQSTATGETASPSRSRTAPVITPITTSSDTQVEKDPRDMSYNEAKADWAKRHRVNLERRQRH